VGTVRQALRTLAAEGVLRVEPGVGSFVIDPDAEPWEPALPTDAA
jgi:DNA-binding GntR family transcriptional regulator